MQLFSHPIRLLGISNWTLSEQTSLLFSFSTYIYISRSSPELAWYRSLSLETHFAFTSLSFPNREREREIEKEKLRKRERERDRDAVAFAVAVAVRGLGFYLPNLLQQV
jgi:hypothetical protein